MAIKHFISHLLAQFNPLALTKRVEPHQQQSVLDLSTQSHKTNPWVDTHLVEVTADDFA